MGRCVAEWGGHFPGSSILPSRRCGSMTNYQCSGCELIFEDWDPMPMGDTGVVVLPTCPTAEALCDILFRQQHEGFPVLETLAQQQEQIEDEHIVRLYIAPKV